MIKRLLLLFTLLVSIGFTQRVSKEIRSWVRGFLANHVWETYTVERIIVDYIEADTINVRLLTGDNANIDTIACDTLYVDGGAYIVRLFMGGDIDMNSNDILEVDSISFVHGVGSNISHFDSLVTFGDTTSTTGLGMAINPRTKSIEIYDDTLQFYSWSSLLGWSKNAGKIFMEKRPITDDASLVLWNSEGGSNDGIEFCGAADFKDSTSTLMYHNSWYPMIDTQGTYPAQLGVPLFRWLDVWARHHFSTSPDKGDTAQIHMEDDSLNIDTENPVAINNDVAIYGDMTSTNAFVDSLDAQHVVVDIDLVIGGGVAVAKWVTRNDSLFLIVGNDSFPIPKKP